MKAAVLYEVRRRSESQISRCRLHDDYVLTKSWRRVYTT